MKHRLRQIAALCLSFPLILALSSTPTAHSQSKRLNVVTTTRLIADVISNVAGDAADVASIVPTGADPHSFQPSGQDIIALDEADLVFVNGANFEQSLLDVIAEIAAARTYVISECVEVREFGADSIHKHEEDADEARSNVDDEPDVAALRVRCDAHYAELLSLAGQHDFVLHEHQNRLGRLYTVDCDKELNCDPHVWMDVENVMLWTLLARDILIDADPDNANTYQKNASEYLNALTELSSELDALFETIPADNRVIITNHDMLGYLAERYDLQIAGNVLVGAGGAIEPSAQDILEIIEIAQDSGAKAIFADNTISNNVAQQVAEETGLPVIPMYTGSLSESDGVAGTYLDYMRFNANLLVGSLSN